MDSSDIKTHHIFFDDNIHLDEAYIVDVWDIYKGKRINFERAINTFICQADLVEAMSDVDYYIKEVKKCLNNRAERLDMSIDPIYSDDQKGVSNLFPVKIKDSREPIDYIKEEVYPHLKPAIESAIRENPSDPLSYISLYILENKEHVLKAKNA
jgi:hypothetical protein